MTAGSRTEKVVSLAEAAALVSSGARIALGGFAVYQHPMAFVRELIRLGRSDLTVVGAVNGPEVDLLAAAGALRRVETSYVGLEQFGLARCYRRAVEDGTVEVVDYSEVLSFDRFRASQDGWTFLPCYYLAGTDLVRRNPEIKEAVCPITGRKFHAVPPANPHVVVIHAAAADRFGNVYVPDRRQLPQGLDVTMARSADTVVATVERIVEPEVLRQAPHLVDLPSYRITCVAEAPWGAHPCSMLGHYRIDELHFRRYVEQTATAAGAAAYLREFVYDIGDEADYQKRVGDHLPGLLVETGRSL